MKILYGVQGTGQGHISRARAMAAAFARQPVEVDWLFSGRAAQGFFDMEPFGDYLHRRGLTFATEAGRIRYRKTVYNNNVPQFLQDIKSLDLQPYDLVVTDFEPVTAWAAKLQGKRSIGIGHQYAFGEGSPVAGESAVSEFIMSRFAPVDLGLGLHWHAYNDHILPPILDLEPRIVAQDNSVLVYLPFEDRLSVTELLRNFPQQRFVQYAPGLESRQTDNVLIQKNSIDGFKRHLHACRAVICNSGFELISECLQLGKPILTKPLAGQMEQESNALALEQLGYARTVAQLDPLKLATWLQNPLRPPQQYYPDVAESLAAWLAGGCIETPQQLSVRLWRQSERWQTPLRLIA